MPEYKVGDRVLVEGVVAGVRHGVSLGVRYERVDVDLVKGIDPQRWAWDADDLRPAPPPGVLGYSEDGHEIRRWGRVPSDWMVRSSTSGWVSRGSVLAAPPDGYVVECRRPEPKPQSLADAARELLGWERDGLVPSWTLDNLSDALERWRAEREGRSDD